MVFANGTMYEKREDGKYVELFSNEADLFKAGTLRVHKQPPCRFQECQQEWYLSEGKLAWHQRKQVSEEGWRMPTSCPMHRDISKIRTIANTTELCVKTSKRSFKAKSEADTFAAARASNNGAPLQYSYECDDCGGFHLSSMSPDQQAALDHAKAISSPSVILSSAALDTAPDVQVCQLFKEGKEPKIIAEKLGMHHLTVYKILRRNNLIEHQWAKPGRKFGYTANTTSVVESDSIDALDAQIQQLLHKKKLLEDAKRLRVELVGTNSFSILKEGEHATLPLSELQPLIELLMTFVPPQPAAARRSDGTSISS